MFNSSPNVKTYVTGQTNPDTGVVVPVVGCFPIASALSGITFTTNTGNTKILNVDNYTTLTKLQKKLLIAGNFVHSGGIVRLIRDVATDYSILYVEYGFPTNLSAASAEIARGGTMKNVSIVVGSAGAVTVQEQSMPAGNSRFVPGQSTGVGVIGYDATGSSISFTVNY